MEIYNREMFTTDGIEQSVQPLRAQLETAEYTYNYLLSQIDAVKKENFKELYIYETLKKTDNTIIPDVTVLTQFKSLEREPTFLEFKKELEVSKKEIKLLNNQINSGFKRISAMFTYTEYNLHRYVSMFDLGITNPEAMHLLMHEICKYEFNDSAIYLKLRWTRGYNVFGLLVEYAPPKWRSFFKDIIDLMIINDRIDDIIFYKEHPQYNNDLEYLVRHWTSQYNIKTGDL